MSDVIKLLPDAVSNQIAAGEVVQRPASVVKELLENAIDAGADKLRLIIKDAGRTLVQLIDNGAGMSETDVRLSVERHATSKISYVNDLFAIRSMGFRGEALASIAAIAHMEIKTRTKEQELGTLLTVEGSRVTEQKPVQTPSGTSISVKNLFYNVPARRNFLKSNPVEIRHIMEEFNRIAIANPGIKMEFFDNDRPRFQLPKAKLKERIINLFGKQYEQRLVPVEEKTSVINIFGFTGKPEFAKKTRGEQYFFVNNRYFKHPYFNHAIEKAYEQLLPEKAFASYFLFFEIDPAGIDINIHPTKTEINFEDGQTIYAILRSAIQKALGRHNLTPSLDFEAEQGMQTATSPHKGPVRQPRINVNPEYNPFDTHQAGAQQRPSDFRRDERNRENWQELYKKSGISDQQKETGTLGALSAEEEETSGNLIQLQNEFIISSVKSGLMLIEQQRAHERVLFEHFFNRLQQGNSSSQKLMFPETLNLSPADSELLQEISSDLRKLGFNLKPKGEQQWEFSASPPNLDKNMQTLIESVLEDYKSQMMNASMDRYANLARAMAKRSAIKNGCKLEQEEMKSLINALFACQMPEYSLDGKHIIRIIKQDELKERFN